MSSQNFSQTITSVLLLYTYTHPTDCVQHRSYVHMFQDYLGLISEDLFSLSQQPSIASNSSSRVSLLKFPHPYWHVSWCCYHAGLT